VQRVVDGEIEFGTPQDPKDPASATLANGTTHNGTLVNLKGSWVSLVVTALDTLTACPHNLAVPVTVVGATNQPNVRWLVFGYQHDGNSATAASCVSCNYETGDAASISEDSFPLRFTSSSGRVVDGDHPLRVDLFFIGAVR
jgi:hypothetical protein